jgi:hypothetical protein
LIGDLLLRAVAHFGELPGTDEGRTDFEPTAATIDSDFHQVVGQIILDDSDHVAIRTNATAIDRQDDIAASQSGDFRRAARNDCGYAGRPPRQIRHGHAELRLMSQASGVLRLDLSREAGTRRPLAS